MKIGLGIGLINKSTTGSVTIPPVVSSVTIPSSIVVNTPIAVSYTIVGSTTTITRTWYRGVAVIATSTTSDLYTPVQADAGNASNIKCVVTATNAAGSSSADSNTVAQVLTARTGAFLTASAISDATIRGGLNTFDIGLISNSLDTKMKALYPFVGGTASTHKFNFMNSADTDAAFRLTFSGSWVHSSNGALPNGVNTFADTFLNSSLILSQNSSHLSYYSRTNSNAIELEIGNVSDSSYTNGSLIEIRTAGVTYYRINSGGTYITYSDTDSRAFYLANRTASNVINGWRNSVKVATGTTVSTSPINNNVYIGAVNVGGTFALPSTKQCAFASIGDGLTDTDAANLYTLTQQLQTTLGRSVGVPIVSDADAQAFLNAANITNATQANAVNTLVIGMKAQGLWTKMKAVYPMVGGTATSHMYNLKDPRNLDVAFRLGFLGSWTHSNTGALPNGTNAFASTFLNPSVNLTLSNHSFGLYSRTENTSGAQVIGAAVTAVPNFFQNNISSGNFVSGEIGTLISYTASPTRAFLFASRTSTSLFKAYRNNTILGSNTAILSTLPNLSFYFGARNQDGSASFYTSYEHAFAFIGDGLTDTDATNYNTLVQQFQTTLGRQNP